MPAGPDARQKGAGSGRPTLCRGASSSENPCLKNRRPRRLRRRADACADYTVQHDTYRPSLRALDQVLRLGRHLGIIRLDADQVLRAARRRTGLTDWGDEAFIPRMAKLIETANDLDLSGLGTFSAQNTFIQAVENRLRIQRYLDRFPEVADIPIRRPIFILGFPRTGTTLLQNLLSLAPGHRELRFWELTSPIPLHDDLDRDRAIRYRKARTLIRLAYFIVLEQRHIHAIDVDSVEECWPLFFNEFAVMNYDLVAHFDDFGDWLLSTDMTEPYRYYRRTLQPAHWQPTTQYLLKCPEHLWFLDALTTVFPDAYRLDPPRPGGEHGAHSSLSSSATGWSTGASTTTGSGATRPSASPRAWSAMAARACLGEDRFFDVNFKDLVRDPATVVRQIRAHFDLDQPPAPKRPWRPPRPQALRLQGRPRLQPRPVGPDPDEVRSHFTDYIDRFDITLEDKR